MNNGMIILRTLVERPASSQRELAKTLGVSLGKINRMMQELEEKGYLEKAAVQDAGKGKSVAYGVTERGMQLLKACQVDCALILASGFGSRFVPLTYEQPKGLLEVFGERMIERQICQLHEVGIRDITIMVGYLKEKFDYLIDRYGVKLRYNPEYGEKNTLATLYHARDIYEHKNCYILSSDNWMRENMYHAYEPCSWYSAVYMQGETREWAMRFGKKGIISEVQVGGADAWCMYGPVYLSREFSEKFAPLIAAYYRMPGTEQFYWEDVYIRNIRSLPEMYANCQPEGQVYEFENLEELRVFDEKYVNDSGSQAMKLVAKVFSVPESEIVNIRCLKSGMTNKSWLFEISGEVDGQRGRSYICRIPGEGTAALINRHQEAAVYQAVAPLGITEELKYFDPKTGYKVSRYYPGARNADFSREEDRRACMGLLKRLHNSGIALGHRFDLRERIAYYEGLCRGTGREIPFEDYGEVREKAEAILKWLDTLKRPKTIAHIDSVNENFIFTEEGLRMIDWEYCGMADPLMDLGMAAIYSYMDYEAAWELLEAYGLGEGALGSAGKLTMKEAGGEPDWEGRGGIALAGLDRETARCIVCGYMGLGGLLWALWGVYKSMLGVTFGDYTLKMYRYLKNSHRMLEGRGIL